MTQGLVVSAYVAKDDGRPLCLESDPQRTAGASLPDPLGASNVFHTQTGMPEVGDRRASDAAIPLH
jgi:hypothetical protein